MQKTTKLPRLTKQQVRFVKIKAETGNGTLAVKKAFGITNDGTARVKAHRLLTNDNIVKSIQDYLPDNLLAQVHLEGLKATTVRFTPEGERIDVDDYATRHKYLDSAFKLKGSYAAEKSIAVVQVSIENRQYVETVASKVIHDMKNGEEI